MLSEVEISEEVKPGGILHLTVNLNNVGFAAPFNPRDVELVLQNDNNTYVAGVAADPRRWEPGDDIFMDKYFRIPADVPEGYYDVKLNLPDPAASLHDNPLYSIQLANDGVWESGTGYNVLATGLHIHAAAPGRSTPDTTFQETVHVNSVVTAGPVLATGGYRPLSSDPGSPTVIGNDSRILCTYNYGEGLCSAHDIVHTLEYRPAGTQDEWVQIACENYWVWFWTTPGPAMGSGSWEVRITIEDCFENKVSFDIYYVKVDNPPTISGVGLSGGGLLSTDPQNPTTIPDGETLVVWGFTDDYFYGCGTSTIKWGYREEGSGNPFSWQDAEYYWLWGWCAPAAVTGSGTFEFAVSITDCLEQTTVTDSYYIMVE